MRVKRIGAKKRMIKKEMKGKGGLNTGKLGKVEEKKEKLIR